MAEIVFQGHGSFRMTTGEGTVVYIDPFAGEGYDAPADLILVSHEHSDHNKVELVTMKAGGRILRAGDFLKDGVYQEIQEKDLVIRGVEACNKNHPRNACVGFLFRRRERRFIFPANSEIARWRGSCLRSTSTMHFFPSTEFTIWMRRRPAYVPVLSRRSTRFRCIWRRGSFLTRLLRSGLRQRGG